KPAAAARAVPSGGGGRRRPGRLRRRRAAGFAQAGAPDARGRPAARAAAAVAAGARVIGEQTTVKVPSQETGRGAMLGLYLSLATVGAVSIILTNVLSLGAGLAALLSFSGVIAAALLISWGAEAAQF